VIKHGKDLSRVAGIWVTAGMLAAIMTGVFIFDEHVSNTNILGIVLGILGIIFMSL
jgi:multidrug transporter EmrE-like cation transporter